jgi:DNA-binding NarL/FixJ family response regulator
MAVGRVMIVDDHPVYRYGVRRFLETSGQFRVIAEAGTAHEALHLAEIHAPDIILLDVQLPGVTGMQVAPLLLRQHQRVAVVFLSVHEDDARLLRAIRLGASGFFLKEADPNEILDGLTRIMQGENLFQREIMRRPSLARLVLAEMRAGPSDKPAEPPPVQLSAREFEVLDCLVMGYSNREIAERLFITEQTVKNHITAILRKLRVDDRVAALRYAIANGWAEIGPQGYASVEDGTDLSPGSTNDDKGRP